MDEGLGWKLELCFVFGLKPERRGSERSLRPPFARKKKILRRIFHGSCGNLAFLIAAVRPRFMRDADQFEADM